MRKIKTDIKFLFWLILAIIALKILGIAFSKLGACISVNVFDEIVYSPGQREFMEKAQSQNKDIKQEIKESSDYDYEYDSGYDSEDDE